MDKSTIEAAIRDAEQKLERQEKAVAATKATLDLFKKALADLRPRQ